MAKKDRSLVPRVNWFDGQKVSEDNLDTEQIHKISNLSNIILDFHGTGIVNPEPIFYKNTFGYQGTWNLWQ